MIDKITETKDFKRLVEPFESFFGDTDPTVWFSETGNIVLGDAEGNYAFFERDPTYDFILTGHYMFGEVRGLKALSKAKQFINFIFGNPDDFNCKVIRGITPAENLGALWLTRRLGFHIAGDIYSSLDLTPNILTLLTYNMWREQPYSHSNLEEL